jgi:hypothetical protein
MSYTCPQCGRTSQAPRDERDGYCGACHDFTGGSIQVVMSMPMRRLFETWLYVHGRVIVRFPNTDPDLLPTYVVVPADPGDALADGQAEGAR